MESIQQKKYEYCIRHYWQHTTSGFSLLEVLLALFVIGILGVSAIRSISALRAQNYRIQHFLLTHASLFETQLFINKQLSMIKPKSLTITSKSVAWQKYDRLFLGATQNDYMDFSLQTTQVTLTHKDNKLYFNDALLLHNVASMRFWHTQIKPYDILSYSICGTICITDSIMLEEVEQALPDTKIKI